MYEKKYHNKDLSKYKFLVTGGAGFIGSNLVEYLLKNGAAKVRVLDNFSTGSYQNIKQFIHNKAFQLIEGDIRNLEDCVKATEGIDYISHQAALGSVPRSINDPITTNNVNISGFLNMLCAAKDNGNIKRFVFAASSSTYGDSKELPKVEDRIGRPISPYAVTKYVNELYADVFAKTYNIQTIGLRYFNVFGPGQSANGEYAAVIPKFILAAKQKMPAMINGDGLQTRDFTFVENAVQANIRAFFSDNQEAVNQIYNVACGHQYTLNEIWQEITMLENVAIKAIHREDRAGDVKHSKASIDKIHKLLGYTDVITFKEGIKITVNSFK